MPWSRRAVLALLVTTLAVVAFPVVGDLAWERDLAWEYGAEPDRPVGTTTLLADASATDDPPARLSAEDRRDAPPSSRLVKRLALLAAAITALAVIDGPRRRRLALFVAPNTPSALGWASGGGRAPPALQPQPA